MPKNNPTRRENAKKTSNQSLIFPPIYRNEKFQKNASFIQRGKRTEDYQRKQQHVADLIKGEVYRKQKEYLECFERECTADDGTSHPYDTLVEKFLRKKRVRELYWTDDEQPPFFDDDNIHVTHEIEPIEDENEITASINNSLLYHFDYDLSPRQVDNILSCNMVEGQFKWSKMGVMHVKNFVLERSGENTNELMFSPGEKQPIEITDPNDLQLIGLKSIIAAHTPLPITLLQTELFKLMNSYQDVYYPERTQSRSEDIRFVYCLHALNHMLKSRTIILRNNEKIAALSKSSNVPVNELSIPDNYRDQGLMRLKVLIILPFRDAAFKVVNNICQLLYGEKTDDCKSNGTIVNYKRFYEDYTGNTLYFPTTKRKPLDYERTFQGNTDDNFKIGLRFTKKSLTLFSDINNSDILIGSPLALRQTIAGTDTEKSNYDFLNSIELLVVDQAEIFLAQNWENLTYVLSYLHLQPKNYPDTNCQRVRSWCLGGYSRLYRQTLMFASHDLPEFRSLTGACSNYQGSIRICNPTKRGTLLSVSIDIPQAFERVDCDRYEASIDARFNHFVNKLLPNYKESFFGHCMVYVPSYFDFVRLRNYFKSNSIDFVQICEYSKKEKIARARDIFFHSGAHFLLYSERAHFFRRTRIKGIRHMIMYQPPMFPHLYPEMVNLMAHENQNERDGLTNSMSVTVLYTKYDAICLNSIVGSQSAIELMKENKERSIFSPH